MGSCISKCNPQKDFQEEDNNHECVKDKLVISQAPISPKISLPSSSSTIQKRVSSSPSSSSSSVSLSSFSSIVTNTTLSSSLSSSSSSSCFKDRSFSNDFLLSCAQEHDRILDIKKINKGSTCVSQNMSSTMSSSSKKFSRSSSSSLSKPPSPRRECNNSTTPKKRPRANSPTIVRQKSFRKEPDQLLKGGNIGNTSNVTSTYHHFPSTRTTLKSPSPSRRFPSNLNGDSSFRRSVVSNGNILSRSSSLRRDNHINNNQPAITPKREGKMRNALQVSPKIDEMEIGEVKSSHDLDSLLMEDINNPLIALDCFIFL
ncbi:uncharacterized protein LOC107793630 [Nicotiana tabacum]|uniref:Uncharacterized protein LOC107793630 n=2 Tax=Nicotiana TaxID=4085 RepID=A0A1S4A4H0_TOBAC|nr:PREDICTED: putative protein TPRXL [Nicotiana sylvestris]XP_016471505.1 PREDICTED: putative protein TPRXL [Nicotiana tabacum]